MPGRAPAERRAVRLELEQRDRRRGDVQIDFYGEGWCPSIPTIDIEGQVLVGYDPEAMRAMIRRAAEARVARAQPHGVVDRGRSAVAASLFDAARCRRCRSTFVPVATSRMVALRAE